MAETVKVLVPEEDVAKRIKELGEQISKDYATIAAELGEAPAGGPHYEALFLLGVVLFFITLIINLSVEYISSKGIKRSK